MTDPTPEPDALVEAVARALYAIDPIKVVNRREPLTFDEAASDKIWRQPRHSYALATAGIAAIREAEDDTLREAVGLIGELAEEITGVGDISLDRLRRARAFVAKREGRDANPF